MGEFRLSRRGCASLVLRVALAGLGIDATVGAAFAQDGALTPAQRHGQIVFAQSCGICHLAPNMGAKTYGPPLLQESANRSPELMRAFITEGTGRMPAFKYYLKSSEIEDVIAYLQTVAAPASANAAKEKAQ